MIGLHLMLDGVMLHPADNRIVESILLELPGRINMKILAGPVVVAGHPENPGWTGFVVIDKSHIALHTFTKSNRISIDVYSCESFDADEVETYILGKIGVKRISRRLVVRSEA
jgi:S-adenosylmethionine/arginine decarboxylase-like enzyme